MLSSGFSRFAFFAGGLLLLAGSACAQSITPGANRNAPSPGGFAPLSQVQLPPGSGEAVNAAAKVEPPKAIHAEVERSGKTGYDIFLGTYLTLSKDCKVGANPVITFPTAPANGTTKIRTYPINLRDVPGAAKRTCIGTSPRGVAAIYQSKPRFKGEDTLVFLVTYPNGDTREVKTKITVK